MGKPKAPDPTPPKETSAAATGTNISTAVANSYLGNINEYGPDGSTRVNQTGMQSVYDPYTNKTYQVPTFSRYTELSPEQQAIKDQQNSANLNLATLGSNLSGTLGQQLTGNFSLGNEETEARLFDLGSKRLDPRFAQQRDDLATQLSNQGIKLGSAAYDRAMNNQGQTENDAYNQLLLQGRGQASQELLTEDNQRINQISALLNGGQVSQPNFMGANMPTIPTTDNAGIIANYDNQKQQQWQAEMAQRNQLMGGLFSFGASMLSDRRAKTNIKKIGKTDDGLNLYSYRYKAGGPTQVGLMAQEVAKVKPEAVTKTPSGLFAVNYDMALAS